MRRAAALIALALALVAPAQARSHKHRSRTSAPAAVQNVCSAGVPTQTITVVNQAGVPRVDLARVERAVRAQSLQLRAAWTTPCLRFALGGWKVYVVRRFTVDPVYGTPNLADRSFVDVTLAGMHGIALHLAVPRPYAVVQTRGDAGYRSWTVVFSHEIVEMLVDPTTTRYFEGNWLEVCDPVSGSPYRIDRVWVSDFTWPSDWRRLRDWSARWDQAGVL